MQTVKSSLLRLLSIDANVVVSNRRSRLRENLKTAVYSYSTNRFEPPAEAAPPLDEPTQRKHFAEAVERAKASALKLLSQRSHSRKELIAKLEERNHPFDAVSKALDRLSEVGLQSDGEFAEVFARSKWRQAKWAPSKIKSELARRGIAPELSKAAIDSVFGPDGLSMRRYIEEELAEEEAGPWNPSEAPEGALLQAARRQHQLTTGLPAEARKRRLLGWLQRRGHPWEVVSRVARRLEEEDLEEERRLRSDEIDEAEM